MAATQNELIAALQTLLSTTPVRLAMRSGLASELELADLVVGEIAVATDTLQVWACTSLGTCIQVAGGLNALAYYATLGALQTAHPTGTAGQIYMVGSIPTHLYTWGTSSWVDLGAMNDTSTFATNVQVETAWNVTSETFTYASSTTITVVSGATSRWQKGDMIKLTQHGSVKYFYVTAVASTLLTVIGETPSILIENTATYPITAINFSRNGRPFGFPTYFTYTPTITWTAGTAPGGSPATSMWFKISSGLCTMSIFNYSYTNGATVTAASIPLPVSSAAASYAQGTITNSSTPNSSIASLASGTATVTCTSVSANRLYFSASYPI